MVFGQKQGWNKGQAEKGTHLEQGSQQIHLSSIYNQRHYCSNIIKSAQRQYFKEKLTENHDNYKEIFRLTTKLLGRDNDLPLPPAEDLTIQTNEFNDFFIGKIETIMQDLAPNNRTDTLDDYLESTFETTERLTNFKMNMNQDILSIINAAPPKSCELDPMPTTLLKVFRDVIAPHIKDIVNTSVVSGRFTKTLSRLSLDHYWRRWVWIWLYVTIDQCPT